MTPPNLKKMSSEELFYIPPNDEIFEELRAIANIIWSKYDDTYWYASEKKDYINSFKNIGSNFMTIFQMFDYANQAEVFRIASSSLVREINNRK